MGELGDDATVEVGAGEGVEDAVGVKVGAGVVIAVAVGVGVAGASNPVFGSSSLEPTWIAVPREAISRMCWMAASLKPIFLSQSSHPPAGIR